MNLEFLPVGQHIYSQLIDRNFEMVKCEIGEYLFDLVMTSRSIFLLLILLVTQRESILALYSNGKTVSDVVIFYNASSRYMRNIVQRAESLFLANRPRSKISLEQEASEVYVNPLPIDSNKIALSQNGASGESLSQIWNISSQTLGAIFVDVNFDALYTSSLLEELDFPTIGIFQSEGQPRTQVHSGS